MMIKTLPYLLWDHILVDVVNVLGLPALLEEHVDINKRKSPYSLEKLSELMILQNILGYDRIESSHSLDQYTVLKEKLGIKRYPGPETFRDELKKYTHNNIGELFFVNIPYIEVLNCFKKRLLWLYRMLNPLPT